MSDFVNWRTDFEWETPTNYVPLRTRLAGQAYSEAWETYTGLPYFIAPMPMGVYVGREA